MFPSTRACQAILFVAVAMCISAAALSAFQRPFGRDSYAQIEQAYAGLPLMVAIWSLECPPCMKELEMLGELKLKYPGFNLVLINTDGLEAVVEAEALLSSFGLSSADAWIYASDQPEQLRFSIDPQWYGELPRSYVYHDGQRQGSSGLIDKMRLQEWLSSAVGG